MPAIARMARSYSRYAVSGAPKKKPGTWPGFFMTRVTLRQRVRGRASS